ncbi:DUF4286 family protein [Dyadobacter sp. 3J3]|uniref:DUF4286 family protein n=1 Tax=Dyadobacter sp. 3J3 TaxID=2606600 RepID=UPI00135C18A1|nr:DUF4286 family protein [Dyadobacter sp. 3J3]
MILFNITVNISHQAEKEWLKYMKEHYIPAVMASGLPVENKLLRLLTEIENEGSTYTNQYIFRTMEDFVAYQTEYQSEIIEKHHAKFNGQYVSFRSLLEEA